MNLCYTGIGSRETPISYLIILRHLASKLADIGYTLRSGGANGADLACEEGCDQSEGQKEIYIPWKGFNNSSSELYAISNTHYTVAKLFHPNWEHLKDSVKKLHARNVSQIIGQNLDLCSAFVICYTPNGKGGGGTGQALRIAKHFDIPIFDIGAYNDVEVYVKDVLTYALAVIEANKGDENIECCSNTEI